MAEKNYIHKYNSRFENPPPEQIPHLDPESFSVVIFRIKSAIEMHKNDNYVLSTLRGYN